MIVPCPACQTRYNVNINALRASGRKVRCSNCGETWHQMPTNETNPPFIKSGEKEDLATTDGQFQKEGDDDHVDIRSNKNFKNSNIDKSLPSISESEEEIAPNHTAKDEREAEVLGGSSVGWLILIVLLCGLCGIGFVYRVKIVEVWPPAGPLLETIGLGTKNARLVIHNVAWAFKKEDGKQVLVVTGEVTNNSQKSKSVSHLLVEIFDDKNVLLLSLNTSTIKSHLDPGHTTKFFTRLADPPASAKNVAVKLQEKK